MPQANLDLREEAERLDALVLELRHQRQPFIMLIQRINPTVRGNPQKMAELGLKAAVLDQEADRTAVESLNTRKRQQALWEELDGHKAAAAKLTSELAAQEAVVAELLAREVTLGEEIADFNLQAAGFTVEQERAVRAAKNALYDCPRRLRHAKALHAKAGRVLARQLARTENFQTDCATLRAGYEESERRKAALAAVRTARYIDVAHVT
jgi:hypothetical protein